MLAGIDVSNYQPVIDWRAVAGAGITFAWTLITDGNRFVNGKAVEQCAGARGVGLDVGGYHFARPNLNPPADEANHFRANAPAGLTLPPALDLEAAWLGTRGLNTDWALRWFDALQPAVRLIYTNLDGIKYHLDSGRLAGAGVELWYAHPTGAPGDFAGYGAWTTPSVVQWGVEPVAGIAGGVDRDSMTEETLARYRGDQPGGPEVLDPNDPTVQAILAKLAYVESRVHQLTEEGGTNADATKGLRAVLRDELAHANAGGAPAAGGHLTGTIDLHPA